MTVNTSDTEAKPVSAETLKAFDAAIAAVTEDVQRQCRACDDPERAMIKGGLGFTSKMLRAILQYGANQIIEDQLAWCATCLPIHGVSMTMVLNIVECYDLALKNFLPPSAYTEVRPYITGIIRQQRTIVENAHGSSAE